MERTGIEPVTADLQIPGFEARLGQIRSVRAKLCWLGEVEIGYSGTRFGTRFWCASAPVLNALVGRQDARAGEVLSARTRPALRRSPTKSQRRDPLHRPD